MAPNVRNFTTGPAVLPDVGELSYNGCTFSPLFETKVSGNAVKDNAKRTIKYIEYTIIADGYVTLPDGATSIGPTMDTLYRLLVAQGGTLVYRGRALDIVVNAGAGGGPVGNVLNVNFNPPAPKPTNDVAWGPVPELLEFQPLGAGRSAKIQWKVTVRLVPPAVAGVNGSAGLLQLNYETTVTYGEDGFSSLSVKGTMEIPMTRRPNQLARGVPTTVDSFRNLLEERILKGIDLGRFRVTKRDFNVSRDKRTLEWDVMAEEKPYMDLPPDCTIARGSYSVRPAKAGPGLAIWLCTLRATYTVRADRPRRSAWLAFLALLRLRMEQAEKTDAPDNNGDEKPRPKIINPLIDIVLPGAGQVKGHVEKHIERVKQKQNLSKRAWLIDFSFDEGLYLDSKTVSFSATWRMTANFRDILIASGIWKKLPEGGYAPGKNLWALSMRDVQGSQSWLPNTLDPNLDVIIDFGSTGP